MNNERKLVLALGLLSVACAPARKAPDTVPAPPDEVLFFDDFTEAGLDRTKWNVRITGHTVNQEQQAYIDSADVIETTEGSLVITARHRPGHVTAEGKTFDFVSERMDTRGTFEFLYGTAAARMKLPVGSGLWPAFWALGTGRWPDTGEIDVMEWVGEPDWTSVALHGPGYSGDATPFVKKAFFEPTNDVTAWHVYSVDWTPDELVFRVDGTIFYTVTRPMVEKFGKWSFDNPKFLIVNLALGGVYPRSVNKAAGPYPGLPEGTIALIGEGKGRVLVDWVRVTRKR